MLFLAILAGMLVALLAMFVTNGSPRDGVLIAGIALAIWVTLYLAGRVFRRKMPPWGLVVLLGGAGLLFLAVFIGSRWLSWLKRPGLVAGVFGTGYALGRILVEHWRLPDAQLGYLLGTTWLTMGIVLSLPVLAAGLALIAYALVRPRG